MGKILVENPVVELNGDEMTRVIWHEIKERLIKPHLEMELLTFDLSVTNRDQTDDQVTTDAANAISRHGVGIKCATVTANPERQAEYNLKQLLPSPNGTLRKLIGAVTLYREPIICQNVPRLVPGWTKPVVICRHAFGDIYRATEIDLPGEGTVKLVFEGKDGTKIERDVYDAPGPGVTMATYNLDESIRNFARTCFATGLERSYPVYFSHKSTILKIYDGRFVQIFDQVYEDEFKEQFEAMGLIYEQRLIDDMVAASLKWTGGYVWACKNYDGDVQCDTLAQGYGSLGMMTSMLVTPDQKTLLTEAAHGTVTRHFRFHQQGKETSTNPMASIFAWTRGLAHRGKLDANRDLIDWAKTLELLCIETIESGVMTKDLASMVGPRQKAVTTNEFIDAVVGRLAPLVH